MKKKLYTCRHQKNAAEPCDTCKKTRGNYGGGQEQGYHCDKCGKLIAKGTLWGWKDGKLDKEYDEEWIEDHSDCQPNSKKSNQQEEVEKIIPMIEKSDKSYSLSCKDCDFASFNYTFSGRITEETKKAAEETLIKLWQKHQQDFHYNKTKREREREVLTPARILITKINAYFVARI